MVASGRAGRLGRRPGGAMRYGDIKGGSCMSHRMGMWGALILGIAVLPGRVMGQAHQQGDLPGPIDNIRDLQDTAKMLFKMADTNNDGQISQKEAVDVGNLL